MEIILLTGGPGCGKSTQGSGLVARNSKIKHLSLGEVVRECIKDPDHPICKQYKELIASGALLPDSVIAEILENEIAKINDPNCIVLLDGYPRTDAQYKHLTTKWGIPAALIHLDVDQAILAQRMQGRGGERTDDNAQAIEKRLRSYQETTLPLINKMKADLKDAFTQDTSGNQTLTNLQLYIALQRVPAIHRILESDSPTTEVQTPNDVSIKSISMMGMLTQMWSTGIDTFSTIRGLKAAYKTHNFSFSLFGRKVVYLETGDEVRAVLEAKTSLGQIYRQFSLAAGLQYDFVATDMQDSHTYKLANNEVNLWKLIHTALSLAMKHDQKPIERLIDKHLTGTFLAEKTFDLDTRFDAFFMAFWSDYLFGDQVSLEEYQTNRFKILTAMKQCFYTNQYKAFDPTGLSSWLYSNEVSEQLAETKAELGNFIAKATSGSLVHRFRTALSNLNAEEHLNLDEDTIDQLVADNIFDLVFVPDFLENVMYEAVVAAIRDNANLADLVARNKYYNEGMHKAFLFPIRARVLEESVTLQGTTLAKGSMVYLNMKQSGVYHSAGPRRCLGQAYAHYFKDHLFKRLAPLEFKVKGITLPEERQSTSTSVPISPERYQVSWRLKRDAAMAHLPFHQYKGNKFFNVLNIHTDPLFNFQILRQLTFKVNRLVQKNKIDFHDVVIVTSEFRGTPIASQLAAQLQCPFLIIRKKGGYKMPDDLLFTENYHKGYGEDDSLELPIDEVKSLAGKKVIFLDDGIASGESALACTKLIEKKCTSNQEPAKVILVMALLKHDYTQTTPQLSEHHLVKTLFDCKSGLVKPSDDVVQSVSLNK